MTATVRAEAARLHCMSTAKPGPARCVWSAATYRHSISMKPTISDVTLAHLVQVAMTRQ